MRKPKMGLIAAVLIAVAAVFALQKLTGGLVPLADEVIQSFQQSEAYYVKTTDNAEMLGNGKYSYTLTGYDASGKKQQIKTEIDKKLHPGAFIKIYAAGAKGKGWVEVTKEEVPEGALAEME